MVIEWYGHSCFKITANHYSIVLDPYNPKMIPGLNHLNLDANIVLASHQHDDHNYFKAVNINDKLKPKQLEISFLDTFHDDSNGAKRGDNKITVIQNLSIKLAHLGDLGCELTKEKIKKLKDLDVLLIPIGGYYTIDALKAKKICDLLKPKVIIPMHYRTKNHGFDVLDTRDKFIQLFNKKPITNYKGNFLEVSSKTNEHIAILEY
ncbi:MAG: MBL fold metallo-hydrolase [Candidatus Izimaplasma sp.]|nr:MBL fold metallo-hydrolase [Candidatus Izimaplasma bacterium]